eukprot:g6727.t1
MATKRASSSGSRKTDIRELSHRMHQLSYREQLMMMASKLASVPMREISEFGKDVLLVVAGLQLQIEIVSMEGTAVTNCFVDAEQHTHQVAEQFAEVEHIFTLVSLGILCVFLVENLLFIVAFRWSFLAKKPSYGFVFDACDRAGDCCQHVLRRGLSLGWPADIGAFVAFCPDRPRPISQEYEEELAEEEGFKDLETCSAEVQRPEGPRAEALSQLHLNPVRREDQNDITAMLAEAVGVSRHGALTFNTFQGLCSRIQDRLSLLRYEAGFECGVVMGLSEGQVMNLWEAFHALEPPQARPGFGLVCTYQRIC